MQRQQKRDLLEERKRLGLKRIEVARAMGVHENRLYDWEVKNHTPALTSAISLLRILNEKRSVKGWKALSLDDFNWNCHP